MAFLLAAGVVLYDHHQLNLDEANWSSRDLAPKVRYVGCALLVIGLMLSVIGL